MIVFLDELAIAIAPTVKHRPQFYISRALSGKEFLPNFPGNLHSISILTSEVIPFQLDSTPKSFHPLLKLVFTNFVFVFIFHMRKSTTWQSLPHWVKVTFHA